MSVLSRLLSRSSPDDGLVISDMRRRDLTAIQVIERQVYPKPWSSAVFTSELDLAKEGQRKYITAYRHGDLVGYAGMMFAIDEAHVSNIAVDPTRQREGIGRRLLAELAWNARGRACTGMTLEVRISNVAAQELYRSFGFEAEGVRRNYYEAVEDAIVMWCHDIDSLEYGERLRELVPEVGLP
jgi:[ribosomal protein S18]-alanine N-acetyltransferase